MKTKQDFAYSMEIQLLIITDKVANSEKISQQNWVRISAQLFQLRYNRYEITSLLVFSRKNPKHKQCPIDLLIL